MHNIDRTVGESNYEFNHEGYELNPESYEYSGEFGSQEIQGEDEFLNELNEMTGESNEYSGEMTGEYSGELSNESLEMELATELLGVTNEAELEQFLGGLFKKVAGAAKSFVNSSTGKAIGGFLKSAAKKALPIVGRVAGTYFGGPLGGQIGSKLGSAASNLFELELEGLSNEDKEFELSKAYVRFATNAVRQAVRDPRSRTNPRMAAKNAIVSSAKRYAPGLLRRIPKNGRRAMPVNGQGGGYPVNDYDNYGYDNTADAYQQGSGSWYRQGNQIILNL